MTFEFQCRACHVVTSLESPIGKSPRIPYHHRRPMRRLYTAPQVIVAYGISDYVDKAYRGEETVPGMSQEEVRATVDSMGSGRP